MLKCFLNLTLAVAITLSFTAFQSSNSRKTKGVTNKRELKVLSFKKDVMPIFKKYCLPCHTEDQMNPSELYLENYGDLLKGGKHGVPIIPGKADSSLLIRKLLPSPPFGDPMPYKTKVPFPQDTLNILKTWIAQGAKNN